MLSVPSRTTSRRALGLILSASLLFSAGTAFGQTPDEDKASARALATQGADALKNGHFAEALDLVSRAESLVHAPTHLLMIARSQTGLGKLVAAQESYLKLSREELSPSAPAAFRNAQATAKEELAAIEPKIASLRIVAEGAAQKKVVIKLDDVVVPPALLGVYRPVDPGHHVIAVIPPGGAPVKTQLDLHDAEKHEIKLTVPDAPIAVTPVENPEAVKQPPVPPLNPPPEVIEPPKKSGSGMRGAGIGIGVVGVGGVVVGAIFLAKGFSAATTANNFAKSIGCTGSNFTTCSGVTVAQESQLKSDDSSTAGSKTIGVIALPIGAAALVTGVVLIALGKPSKPAPTTGTVTPWFGGTSGGLRGTF